MFTLFWAGDVFAPLLKVKVGDKEVSAQTFLQDAFMGTWEQLARAVGHLDAVVGFEVLWNLLLTSHILILADDERTSSWIYRYRISPCLRLQH